MAKIEISTTKGDWVAGSVPKYKCTSCGKKDTEESLMSCRDIQYRYKPKKNKTIFTCSCGNIHKRKGTPREVIARATGLAHV